jgi:hypothetical protein
MAKLLGFGTLALCTLILGFWGLAEYQHGLNGFWDILYNDLQLFVVSSDVIRNGGYYPPALQVARFAAPAVTAYALISAAFTVLSSQRRELRIRRSAGHDVVCGAGQPAFLLAKRLRAEGRRVILVESVLSPDLADACLSSGVLYIESEPGSIETLQRVAVHRAEALYAVSPDNAMNVAITVLAHRLTLSRRRPLRCYVAVTDRDLSSALMARILGSPSRSRLELNLFSETEISAHFLLDQTTHAGLPRRAAIVGLGDLGQALAVELAHRWQGHHRLTGELLQLTLVDDHADLMRVRHPVLEQVCQIDLVAASADVPGWWNSPELVFVCGADTDGALAIGLRLLSIGRGAGTRVTVCVDKYGEELSEVFQDLTGGPAGLLSIYGTRQAVCDPRFIRDGVAIERIARSLHGRYLDACLAEGGSMNGNEAMCTWERLPERLRESNRDQARHIGWKLDAIGCYLLPFADVGTVRPFTLTVEEIEQLAHAEHLRWMTERAAQTIDHPDMVDWDLLSESAREKDRAFVRAIPDVLADVGFRVMRSL